MKLTRRSFLKTASLAAVPAITARLWARSGLLSATDAALPNILVVVLDTLSAASMSLYGYDRATTPELARLATSATVYHNHYSAGNYTVPGTASLLTGAYPFDHRAFHHRGSIVPSFAPRNLFDLFSDSPYSVLVFSQNLWVDYLFEQFESRYAQRLDPSTYSLVNYMGVDWPRDAYLASTSEYYALHNPRESTSLFAAPLLQGRNLAKRRRFQSLLKEEFPRGLPMAGEKSLFVLEDAIDGLQSIVEEAPRPFVAYFHLWPPHSPYNPRAEFIDIFDPEMKVAEKPRSFAAKWRDDVVQGNRLQYDENVAYADAEFGRLFDYLCTSGLLDNTLVVFTSDHGELFERGVHGHNNVLLYEPLIKIPLLIWQPGQTTRRDVYELTSCVDLLPTLQAWRGAPIPPWAAGRVLPGFENGTVSTGERPVFAVEAKSNPKLGPFTKATLGMRYQSFKLIYYTGYDGRDTGYELFDLDSDPEEVNNIFDQHPDAANLANMLQDASKGESDARSS